MIGTAIAEQPKTLRIPAVVTEGNGDLVKFQSQVDDFCKKHNVVEKHYSFTMIPIEKKATMIQGIGRGFNMQLQMIPVCYMIVEKPMDEAMKEANTPKIIPFGQ